jgi:hypothetical protein
MDTINNDIYLSTIFNACEEKILSYEELLQKVNLYCKNANFDEETFNKILEEVEKYRIHKKEYSNLEKREYLSKLMLDESVEKYGNKVVDNMSDWAVDKVFENEVKEIKDEDIDNVINPKKEPIRVKVRVRNEIPYIDVAKEVARDIDKLEMALIDTYNGVTIEEILSALIASRKKGMNIATTQSMEHLIMYYALKGRKGLSLDEKQRALREIKNEKERDKIIIDKILSKMREENNNTEVLKEEKEEILESTVEFDKELVKKVAGNNLYLEKAILLGSINGTKLEDILDGVIKLRKNGEDFECTKEMSSLVDSYAISGKLNSNVLNAILEEITKAKNQNSNVSNSSLENKEVASKESIENIENIELAKELSNDSEMLSAVLISKVFKGVELDLLVKALVSAKKQGDKLSICDAMNVLADAYEKEGKITDEALKNAKLILAKERKNKEKGFQFANQDYDTLDNSVNNPVKFSVVPEDLEEDKKKNNVVFPDIDSLDFDNVVKNVKDAKDSNVRKVDASEERIKKLKKYKLPVKSGFIKAGIIVFGLVILGPEAGLLGIASYNAFALLIKNGKFDPKTKVGKSIKDTVINIMSLGYSESEKDKLYETLSKVEQASKKEKEEREGKTK